MRTTGTYLEMGMLSSQPPQWTMSLDIWSVLLSWHLEIPPVSPPAFVSMVTQSKPPLVRRTSEFSSSVPSRTWTDFADITEKLTGKPITRKYTSVTQIEQDVLAGKQVFFPVWVICGSKFADFTDDCDNELLNPAQRYFKPKSFEDFVRSVRGMRHFD